MVPIKSAKEIERMQRAGELASEALAAVAEEIAPGVTTARLDEIAEERITRGVGRPSFKGYLGYPRSICASVNDAVVHGIPDESTVLQEGDIVGIDLGAQLAGLHADLAATFGVGEISEAAERLLEVTREACLLAVDTAVAGKEIGDISRVVQQHVESAGFSVVRDLVGHGVGRSLHEEPRVPNFYEGDGGPRLKSGMALAIEPMVNAGDWRVKVGEDRWTVRTADGSLSAHFEHTVIVRKGRALVVTRWPQMDAACERRRAAASG